MSRKYELFGRAAACATIAIVAATASAQSVFQVHGEVLAADGLPVPGVPGAVFGGSGSFDFPSMDESGRVLFRARFTGGGVTAANERAYFIGRTSTDLTKALQGGDPVSALPGLTHSVNSSGSQGLGGSPRLSPGGLAFFSSALAGAGLTTTNDSALFAGVPGGFLVAAREGDAAPGTIGAAFSTSFANLSHQPTGMIDAFRVLFQSSLLGGDVSGTTNNAAWFSGVPGNLELVQRKGDALPTGEVIGSLGFVSQMNQAGQIVLDASLSTTLGAPPATAANNTTLWLWTPGLGSTLLLREGDAAPGTLGATFANATNSWSVSTGSNSFNSSAMFAMNAELFGGDVVPGVNDRGVYLVTPSGHFLLARKGDPVPNSTANFGVVNNSSLNLNASADVAFQTTLTGAGVTTANDQAIFIGGLATPFEMIARKGDPAPGTVGAVFGDFNGFSPFHLNDKGQLIFRGNLVGGDVVVGVNESGTYAYDPVVGVTLLFRSGDVIEVAPGDNRTITSYGGLQFNNGGGAALSFNHDGNYVTKVQLASGGSAILRGRVGTFAGDNNVLSTTSGGTQELKLTAGFPLAGGTYIVAGSGSGTAPGFSVGPFLIPLNPDIYFQYTLDFPNIPPLVDTLGGFGPTGLATAKFVLPPGLTVLAGLSVHHAYAAVDNLGNVVLISEPVRLDFTL